MKLTLGSGPAKKKNKYLEDHLFLTQQLKLRNVNLQKEIEKIENQIERNSSNATEIEINKTYLKERAKEAHVIKTPLELEHDSLVEKAKKQEKLIKVTLKNFDVELKYGMNEIEEMKEKNQDTKYKIAQTIDRVGELENQREKEMLKLKEMHELRVKAMINNLQKELDEQGEEGKEINLDEEDKEIREFLKSDNENSSQVNSEDGSDDKSGSNVDSDTSPYSDSDDNSRNSRGNGGKINNYNGRRKLGLIESDDDAEYKVRIYNSNGKVKNVKEAGNKKLEKNKVDHSMQVDFGV